jgi:hypothetical protein
VRTALRAGYIHRKTTTDEPPRHLHAQRARPATGLNSSPRAFRRCASNTGSRTPCCRRVSNSRSIAHRQPRLQLLAGGGTARRRPLPSQTATRTCDPTTDPSAGTPQCCARWRYPSRTKVVDPDRRSSAASALRQRMTAGQSALTGTARARGPAQLRRRAAFLTSSPSG